MAKKGTRLDIYLSKKNISISREKAKSEIMSGWIKVNEETVRQPSRIISEDDVVTVERPGGIFVSRGGEKLNHALDFFHISVEDRIIADLGASTGGFTDCLLRRGAQLVYAIDVGYGQLDYKLRNDSRVVVMERVNVRNLKISDFNPRADFVTVDLSFISIVKAFDRIREVFAPAYGIILIKPQFEAQSHQHKKGVVRYAKDHKIILEEVISSLMGKGMLFNGLTFSPIRGPAGNIEFLLYFSILPDGIPMKRVAEVKSHINTTVDEAHNYFNSL
jgi:23S rRNA (cytidine1920-2'-O)/16S rRNA (cytidine1409-2'-O)-methyltransferase